MNELEYDLVQLCKRNRDGARATQVARQKILLLAARQLRQMGYRHLRLHALKSRHIEQVTELWQHGDPKRGYRPLTTGTLKNRLAHLRWWAEKINKQNVVPRHNKDLGVGKRAYVFNRSKAVRLYPAILDKITDPYIKMSLQLQAAFGLRREEAMKINPRFADRGDHLLLKGSWCKGGRERKIPIRTSQQRYLIIHAKQLTGAGSLIPAHKRYREHKHAWEYQTKKAGISRTHGLRHQYAQQRYLELTGWKAPAARGQEPFVMTPDKSIQNYHARRIIAEELGHSRIEITNVYLGR